MLEKAPSAEHPLVSIVLPVHRDHQFLDASVASMVSQTYTNFELVMVVNGCDDATWHAFQRFSDPRVRMVRTNLCHLPFALNLGIHVARGDLVARMDSDDISHPQRIEKQVAQFMQDPSMTVLGTRYEEIDETGSVVRAGPLLPDTNARIRRKLPYRCALAHPTVMFRKGPVEHVGGYMYGSPSEDYDLWLRLSRDDRIVFGAIPEPLLQYRVHGGQETSPGSIWKIFASDFSLKVREFFRTGHVAMLAGAAYSIAILVGSPLLRKIRAFKRRV